MDPALLEVELLYPRGFFHATEVPLSPSITMWIFTLLKASACRHWRTCFSAFLSSGRTWTSMEDGGTRHCRWITVLCWHREVFSGTIEEGKAACPLSKYPETPTTEPLLCLIGSDPPLSLSLLTAVLVLACPYLQMVGLPVVWDHGKPDDPFCRNCVWVRIHQSWLWTSNYIDSEWVANGLSLSKTAIQDLWHTLAARRILFHINSQRMSLFCAGSYAVAFKYITLTNTPSL